MQFVLILAVLAAIIISDGGPNRPVPGEASRLALAVAGMMLVALFAQVSSGLIARRLRAEPSRPHLLLHRFRQLRQVHAVLWLAVAGAILYCLEWGPMVRFNWRLDRAFLLDDLLVLTPVLAPLVLSWAAFYQVEKAVHARLVASGLADGRACGLGRYLALHVRHYLGVLLVPVLVLLAVQDAVELASPGWMAGRHAVAVHAPLLIALFVGFPLLLRHVWQTHPLPPGPLRERLEGASQRLGFHAREILVWNTGGLVVNAAVTGLTRHLRYVFLSDGLLERLDAEEIEAVFGHELGHVRHRHMALRLGAMLAPLSVWLFLVQVLPDTTRQVEEWVAEAGPTWNVPLGLAALAAMGAYLLVVFGWYSRLLECQADLFACHALGMRDFGRPAPEVFATALEKLASAGGADRDCSSWQHASIARRVAFLRRAAGDARFVRRFQRGVGLVGIALAMVVLSPLAFYLLWP